MVDNFSSFNFEIGDPSKPFLVSLSFEMRDPSSPPQGRIKSIFKMSTKLQLEDVQEDVKIRKSTTVYRMTIR